MDSASESTMEEVNVRMVEHLMLALSTGRLDFSDLEERRAEERDAGKDNPSNKEEHAARSVRWVMYGMSLDELDALRSFMLLHPLCSRTVANGGLLGDAMAVCSTRPYQGKRILRDIEGHRVLALAGRVPGQGAAGMDPLGSLMCSMSLDELDALRSFMLLHPLCTSAIGSGCMLGDAMAVCSTCPSQKEGILRDIDEQRARLSGGGDVCVNAPGSP